MQYIYTYTHIYTNGMGEWQVETIRYKIGSWEIQSIFYDRCKWKVIIKICIRTKIQKNKKEY